MGGDTFIPFYSINQILSTEFSQKISKLFSRWKLVSIGLFWHPNALMARTSVYISDVLWAVHRLFSKSSLGLFSRHREVLGIISCILFYYTFCKCSDIKLEQEIENGLNCNIKEDFCYYALMFSRKIYIEAECN